MTRIVLVIVINYDNQQFKCKYLRSKKLSKITIPKIYIKILNIFKKKITVIGYVFPKKGTGNDVVR